VAVTFRNEMIHGQGDSHFDIDGDCRGPSRGGVTEMNTRTVRFAGKRPGPALADFGPDQQGVHGALKKCLRKAVFVVRRIGTMRGQNQIVTQGLESFLQFQGQEGEEGILEVACDKSDRVAAPDPQPARSTIPHVSQTPGGLLDAAAGLLAEPGISRGGVEDAGGSGGMNLRQAGHVFQIGHETLTNS
jgi:hypothetical protein